MIACARRAALEVGEALGMSRTIRPLHTPACEPALGRSRTAHSAIPRAACTAAAAAPPAMTTDVASQLAWGAVGWVQGAPVRSRPIGPPRMVWRCVAHM